MIHLSRMLYLFVNVIHDWRNMCFGRIYYLNNAQTFIIFQVRGYFFDAFSEKYKKRLLHIDLHIVRTYIICYCIFPKKPISMI